MRYIIVCGLVGLLALWGVAAMILFCDDEEDNK